MRIDQALRSGLFAIVVTILAGSPAMAQAEDGGPTEEGIEVHGHWIIEVYEGGEIVERREFENALVSDGDRVLLGVLGSQNTLTPWVITFSMNAIGDEVTCPLGQTEYNGSCYDDGWRTNETGYAQMQIPESGDNAGKLVLTQSFVLDGDFMDTSLDIDQVATGIGICPSTLSPDTCSDSATSWAYITSKTLPSPITVQPDQQVDVTVVISLT